MVELTGEEVRELQKNGEKILVDFYADWCSSCKQLTPRLEEINDDFNNVKFIKINVEKNKDFAVDMGIRSLPTVMIFNGEDLIDRSVGAHPNFYYKNLLDTL